MDTEQNTRQATEAQDEASQALSGASELVARGDNRSARKVLKQAMNNAGPDDRARLAALDRSLRMDRVAKIALIITGIALAIVAYVSLLH